MSERARKEGELVALRSLLAETPADDVIVRFNLTARIHESEADLATAVHPHFAQATLTFSGMPVDGSRGIAMNFAGAAVKTFEHLVAVLGADRHGIDLKARGPVPGRAATALQIVGTAHGSFGFILEQVDAQTETQSDLAEILDITRELIGASTTDDDFDEVARMSSPRTIKALGELLEVLSANNAGICLTVGPHEVDLPFKQALNAHERVHATEVTEGSEQHIGLLDGFMTSAAKFELKTDGGTIITGTVSKTQLTEVKEHFGERVACTLLKRETHRGAKVRVGYLLVSVESAHARRF